MRIVRSSTNNPKLNKLLNLPPIHFVILEGDEKEPAPGVLPDSCLCILREVKSYLVSGLVFKHKEEKIHYLIHWIAKEFEAYTSAGGYSISYAAGSVIGETNLDGLREIMLDRDYTLHLLEGIYRNTKQLSDASVENVYETVTSQTASEIIRRREQPSEKGHIMNEFKKGDKIVITTVGKKPLSGRYFWKGDIGVIIGIYQLPERRYSVDFNNQGNKKVRGDGRWSVSSGVTRDDDRYAQFKLYEAPEVIDWTKYEGKEAWFSISGGTKEWFKGKLYKYDPELTPSFLAILDKDQDTIRQFTCIKTSGEINWSKITVGTKVIVSDTPDFSEPKTKEFLCYTPDRGYPFWAVAGSETANAYKYCKLA